MQSKLKETCRAGGLSGDRCQATLLCNNPQKTAGPKVTIHSLEMMLWKDIIRLFSEKDVALNTKPVPLSFMALNLVT